MATGGCERSISKGCDECFNDCCTLCSVSGRTVEAVNFCAESAEYFCSKCVQYHNKFAVMKTHQVLDKAGMKARVPQQAVFPPMERCPQHLGNIIDKYCGMHDEVGCSACVSINHRSCEGMAYLPTVYIAKGIKNSKEYKYIKSSMKNTQKKLDKIKKARQDELITIDQENNEILTQIKDFRKWVIKRLDELEKTATDKLKAKHQAYRNKIQTDIKKLNEILTSMESNRRKLETSTGDNDSQLFVYVKTGKKNETDGRKLLQEMETSPERRRLKFNINPNIENVLKSQTSVGHFQINDQVYSATLQGEYNMNARGDDSNCDILGSCQLNDGTILVTDNNNKKLKRLDRSYQVRDHCDLPCEPFAVCATGPQEVAVTLNYENKVQFVSVGDKMTLTRSFSVEFDNCRGIAYTDDQLFVSCVPGSLLEYDRSGTLLNTVQQDSTGQNMLLSDPIHIALSNDSTKIHIADENVGVITLDTHGDKQSQFTDPELRNSYGVCIGNNDDIFVCGYSSHNILQIGRDGRKLKVVLGEKDGIKNPQSLCWDRVNSRLIVTMDGTDNIKLFDMHRN